ncbi:MAG: class I SAM-dependent methyltransferase [Eubacterium sp.]
MKKNMTALVSCFARAYHTKHNNLCIYKDALAEKILTVNEYRSIAENMVQGIKFFNPDFKGDNAEALRWIVNNNLAPTVVGRSAFCERLLENAICLGCRQYLIFASGYDTSAYKYELRNMLVIEIDKEEIINDKKSRIERLGIDLPNIEYAVCDFSQPKWTDAILKTGYDENRMSFSSLMGISYYLTSEQFDNMIKSISSITCQGSEIVFDYPTADKDIASGQNRSLAYAAGEAMKAEYTYAEIERLMSKHGYLIYEHLDSGEIEKQYFEHYNMTHKYRLRAPQGVAYCLAVKKY